MLSALTPSHADSVQSPPPLMGELEGVSLRKRRRRVLALGVEKVKLEKLSHRQEWAL